MVDATTGTTTATGTASTGPNMSDTERTCNTCVTKFDSKEAKREHMKSDWQAEDVSSDDSSQFRESGVPNEPRGTKKKTGRSHFKPRNHSRKSVEPPSAEIPSLTSLEDSHSEDEEEQFNPRQCLFCNSDATSLDVNMEHMSFAHSFFIPDAEYLIDLESLLSYLFIIVSDFHECLYCGSVKSSKFAAQDHMRGKGHCKIDLEDEGHALRQFYDFEGDADSDEESQDAEEDVTLVPDGDELRLPLGKILGHRSRARYFRQRVPVRATSPQKFLTEGEAEEVPAEGIQSKDQRIVMRAGTSTSMIGIPEVQRRALVAVEQKMMKIEARTRNEYEAHVQRKANQQKRFKVKSMGKKQGGLEKRLG